MNTCLLSKVFFTYLSYNLLLTFTGFPVLRGTQFELVRVLDNLRYAKFKLKDKTVIDDLLNAQKLKKKYKKKLI